MENESLLIARSKEDDLESFSILIDHYQHKIYNLCLRMMNSPEDAKDMAQETFIKAFQNIKKFQGRSAFGTWLYQIALNQCKDALQKHKKERTSSWDEITETQSMSLEKSQVEPLPEKYVLAQERCRVLQKNIDELSLELKNIIVLRDIEGLSYAEIGQVLQISLGTVKSRISRARCRLAKMLSKQEELFGNNKSLKDREGGSKNEM